MSSRLLGRLALATSAALLLACGDAEPSRRAPPVDAAPPPPISGIYKVSGTTVETTTGSERGVSGTVILHAEGDSYTATFSLATTLHASGEAKKAELVGKGEGSITGRKLAGTAETQLIVALVPGVDAGFAMLPRRATARILNQSDATIDTDGGVQIEIESEPAPGQSYAPTRTTLRGRRVSSIGLGNDPE